MTDTLRCDDSRRKDVAEAAGFNGIDYVEIASADQRTLTVQFLLPLPGEPGGPAGPVLTPANVRVDGGVRVLGVVVTGVVAAGDVLTVSVDRAGDFSPYTLRLIAAPGSDQPPTGFDPALSWQRFSFKAACPSPFDCRPPALGGTPRASGPVIDYLARDFDGLVRLLADRLSLTGPDWRDRSPADPQMALVELLADLGDRLAYEQDAAATEAYLNTARSRISLRRHARLLDYPVDDGANATGVVCIEVVPAQALDGQVLPAGERVLTGAGGGPAGVPSAELTAELRAGAIVFQTLDPVALSRQRNRIRIHTWSDADCTLAAGATSVALVRQPGLTLTPGDLLLLEEERSPITGSLADADPRRRHLVRLTSVVITNDPVASTPLLVVGWARREAIPFDLTLNARVAGGGSPVDTAVARGNLVRVEHGTSVIVPDALVVPPDDGRPYRPRVELADLAMSRQVGGESLPAIELDDGSGLWQWRPAVDLLGAAPDDPSFTVEFEQGHRPQLRFGNGRFGRRPTPGTRFSVRAKVGTGLSGNVGADALSRLVTATPDAVRRVRNPLPASGGRATESRDHVVTHAPSTLHIQERAVTIADWVEVAQRHPEVQRAAARIRWTGSWWTVFVAIDRVGGGSVLADGALAADLRAHLDRFRMAGLDVELADPQFVSLDLQIDLSVEAGHFRSDVARAVRAALSPGPHPDGRRGLFHPDRLTFGQPLYLSQVHAAIDAVPGVRCAEIVVCHPLGKTAGDELTSGVVVIQAAEVLRLDDDPNMPEHGRLRIDAKGGV